MNATLTRAEYWKPYEAIVVGVDEKSVLVDSRVGPYIIGKNSCLGSPTIWNRVRLVVHGHAITDHLVAELYPRMGDEEPLNIASA